MPAWVALQQIHHPTTPAPATKDATVRTIAIVNQKGGCGKTTTAINLAALYAQRGLRTLLVDMDPQSHCAVGLGVPEARIEYSIAEALLADHARGFESSSLIWEVARNLYLAPSTVKLAALEAPGGGLHQLADKDRRLESLLHKLADRYDRCLIDCPPTIGLLTFNAMRAAREALIPVETGFFSLRGAERQWQTIQRLINHIGRPIACHLLATLHDPQSQLACNILAALRRQFAGQILPVVIHEHEVLREAASFGQPVLEYAPESKAREDFEALADWLEEHATRPAPQIEIIAVQPPPSISAAQSQRLEFLDEQCPPALEPFASTGADQPGPENGAPAGGRAAELARRMHHLAARGPRPASESPDSNHAPIATVGPPAESATAVAEAPAPSDACVPVAHSPLALSEPITETQPPQASAQGDLTHLFGVRQTSAGILFVQPANSARTISIAGDFNYWSPTADPLQFNSQAGVFERIINLARGAYQYRVIVDGQWLTDSHNPQRELNSYGEPNSVVVVS